MDFMSSTMLGLSVATDPLNLFYCFIGTILGTLIGVLPGIGPAATIALLLPITFKLSAVQAVIMLSGIYYGAMYGGSTTSILVNIPGEASCVTTCFDGHAMAKKGKAGVALGISAFGSFIGGTVGVIALQFLGAPLASFALKFGPPEYFGLLLMGMILVIYLSSKSVVNGLIMGAFGILLATVGIDVITADKRFTFNINEISDGIEVVSMVMGLFGISEVLLNLEREFKVEVAYRTKFKNLFPSLAEWGQAKWAIVRGTLVGFLLGVLPGGGAMLSNFVAYAVEKKAAKNPEEFGQGRIEGVAAPETANNAASTASFIPLLILGIPPNIVLALLIGTFMIHGLQPGPLLITEHPQVFWGTVMSMYIGNVMCMVFNLPLIGVWVQLLRVPYKVLFPLIILFCTVGSYSINSGFFDVLIMLIFGIVGYVLRKLEYELGPLVLAFIISRMLETALRQSLTMSGGDFSIFFYRPIAAVTIVAAIVISIFIIVPNLNRMRLVVAEQAED